MISRIKKAIKSKITQEESIISNKPKCKFSDDMRQCFKNQDYVDVCENRLHITQRFASTWDELEIMMDKLFPQII